MLQKRVFDNGVTIYESTLLAGVGVPHAFSTRLGGVSEGPFASLNLGNPGGQAIQDSPQNIAENYRRLQAAIGCEGRARLYGHQVHGATVLTPERVTGDCELGKGDAIVCDSPDALASVRTADCVPVLLASRDGRRVAAVHAGWRGTVAGVVAEALKHFDSPATVIAAIGPCIGFNAFEVGLEVAEQFATEFVRHEPNGKAHVDLKRALAAQLIAAGVPGEQVESTDRCTVSHADEFFSHRRTGGLTGRMAAVIGVCG